jgi:phage shock protein C
MTKLYRSKTDNRIAGVCGGIAEKMDVDSTLVRIVFFVSIFTPLPAVLFYLACWLIIPQDPGYKKQ